MIHATSGSLGRSTAVSCEEREPLPSFSRVTGNLSRLLQLPLFSLDARSHPADTPGPQELNHRSETFCLCARMSVHTRACSACLFFFSSIFETENWIITHQVDCANKLPTPMSPPSPHLAKMRNKYRGKNSKSGPFSYWQALSHLSPRPSPGAEHHEGTRLPTSLINTPECSWTTLGPNSSYSFVI